MSQEIERKFKVKRKPWTNNDIPSEIVQGYLSLDSARTVRIRTEITENRGIGTITVKGEPVDIVRNEYEYKIPFSDAQQLLENGMCIAKLRKRRYSLMFGGHLWYIDEFLDNNAGLVLAELELTHTTDSWEKPEWLGEEVTHDPNYYNSRLVIKPQIK